MAKRRPVELTIHIKEARDLAAPSDAKGNPVPLNSSVSFTLLNLAKELVSAYHSYDSYVGHCYLGGFYTAAPWPLQDRKRGLAEFETAYKLEPRARRNGYYACLLRYHHEDYGGAVAACEAALSTGRCDGPTTPDYCPFLTEQTKRMLGLAKKAAAKKAGK